MVGHHSGQVEWHIAKNSGLPLKYSDLVNAITAFLYILNNAQGNRQRSLEPSTRAPPVRDWQIDYIGPIPPTKGLKYAFVCVDTAFGLTQAFPLLHKPGYYH